MGSCSRCLRPGGCDSILHVPVDVTSRLLPPAQPPCCRGLCHFLGCDGQSQLVPSPGCLAGSSVAKSHNSPSRLPGSSCKEIQGPLPCLGSVLNKKLLSPLLGLDLRVQPLPLVRVLTPHPQHFPNQVPPKPTFCPSWASTSFPGLHRP